MGHELIELMEKLEPEFDDTRSMVTSLQHTFDELVKRNSVLDRAVNDALLAIKARDVEIESLRLQLAEAHNRTASVQADCDERVGKYQDERDIAVAREAEYAALFGHFKRALETVEIPAPRIPVRRKRKADALKQEQAAAARETDLIDLMGSNNA